jgi:hypothetical protein
MSRMGINHSDNDALDSRPDQGTGAWWGTSMGRARFQCDVSSRSAGLVGQVYGAQGFDLGMGETGLAMPSSANDLSFFDDHAANGGIRMSAAQTSPGQNNGLVHEMFV